MKTYYEVYYKGCNLRDLTSNQVEEILSILRKNKQQRLKRKSSHTDASGKEIK